MELVSAELLPGLGALALVALLVLATLALSRIAALGREREATARELAELRTRFDGMAQASAQHERDMRGDLAGARQEQGEAATALRREVGERLGQFTQAVQAQLAQLAAGQAEQAKLLVEQLAALGASNEERLGAVRATMDQRFEAVRTTMDQRLEAVRATVEERLENVRGTVEQRLDLLRGESAHKLEQMRAVVDEKLQATLDQRLGESFKLVSERLEQVHKGLGEMQSLATGVGDLKRVLTNVKTRGTWGEVQLGTLLADFLTPQQYGSNVETIPGSNRRVEFAIRLPGRGDEGHPCWIPVDSKFPLDDWQRLQDALERADAEAADEARRALAAFLRNQARSIRDLYVASPHTTDFAILFVPLESLYAEMMARPGLADQLQRDYRVTMTGPTNFLAFLNSLQMGFRTLAIEQRSSEVWRTLGAVKTEFAKFGDVLARTKDRIDRASKELESAGVRTRALERHLRAVDALPEPEAARVIGPAIPYELGEAPEEK
jgi:DNA recombination protein RmuC